MTYNHTLASSYHSSHSSWLKVRVAAGESLDEIIKYVDSVDTIAVVGVGGWWLGVYKISSL